MQDVILRITLLQMKLRAEVTREVQHGATLKETYEAMAETITVKLKTPVSSAWVSGFNRNNPRTLVHASVARVTAVERLLTENWRIWDTEAS